MNDNKLTAEEKKAIRNLIIWFLAKVGIYYAIQIAITKYLEREYGSTDPHVINAKINAEKSPSKIIFDGITNPSFQHMKEKS